MSEFIPEADTIASLLLTYLVHSTLVVLLIACVLRWWRSARPDVRVLLWKVALVLPLLTTIVASIEGVPQAGLAINVASINNTSAAHKSSARDSSEPLVAQPVWSSDLRYDKAAFGKQTSNQSVVAGEQTATSTVSSEFEPKADQTILPSMDHKVQESSAATVPIWSIVCLAWFVGAVVAMVRLVIRTVRLRSLRNNSSSVTVTSVLRVVAHLRKKAGIQSAIHVVESDQVLSPLAGGIMRPFVAVPSKFLKTLTDDELEALFAHELVHIMRRDNLWKLVGHLVCQVFFVQPLNRFAQHQLDLETEFVADEQAAQLLDYRAGLADCLCRLGEWLVARPRDVAKLQPLATGMASFRSTLGKRVETLLTHDPGSRLTPGPIRGVVAMLVIGCALVAISFAPRAVADARDATPPEDHQNSREKDEPMKQQLTALALLAGLTMPATADEPKQSQPTRPAPKKTTADDLPDGIARFNGMLVGRLVKKDVEKGTFLVNVDAVPRVWRNSKAERPKSIVGKNIEVDGVSGKWLDVLLVVKAGETLEFEARHDGGNRLTFPGELLRKVAPFDPKDYPELPEEFRGFKGAVAGKIVKKDPETFELIVKVDRVIDTWKGNQAKDAKSIEGKQMMLAGFWRRKDQYHSLKVGDRIESGMQHIGLRSDHLTVAEFVRKSERSENSPTTSAEQGGLPQGIRGFQGALVGRLVKKDVEKGTLEITVDAVPRIWRNNKARQPKSIVGKSVAIDGLSSRFLDVLLTTKKGETLEVAARHDRGNTLTFPGELFRKVAPYKAEDYPVLPAGFRGFQGQISAEIVKRDPEMYGLIIKVTEVKRSFENSRAKEPASIEGKNAILAGFWRRKEMYSTLKVGDRIEAGVRNETTGTDVVSVIEGVRKVGSNGERE